MSTMGYRHLVRLQKKNNPCLAGLDNFLSDPSSDQRPCRMLRLEFPPHASQPNPEAQQVSIQDLSCTIGPSEERQRGGQILIVEDLSRDVIETLGIKYRIDPLFFASHLHAPFRQLDAQTPNLAILPSRLQSQNFINIHYHRTIELKGEVEHEKMLTRDMNVSRKVAVLVPTEGNQIALVQHACSVIMLKETVFNRDWLCIILVDRPVFTTHIAVKYDCNDPSDYKKRLTQQQACHVDSKLFLNGYEDFMPPAHELWSDLEGSFSSSSSFPGFLSRESLLCDLKYYWGRKAPESFDPANPTIFAASYYPLKIISAEWNNYMAAMSSHIKRHEYAVETTKKPMVEMDRLNSDLRSLQVWRRRCLASQQKLAAINRFVISRAPHPPQPSNSAFRDAMELQEDYRYLAEVLDDLSNRLGNMLPVVTSLVQISDSRRALTESANISRLTSLAVLFVPLSFTTGLFSMNPTNAPGGPYFWVFFAVAIPITLLVFLFAKPPLTLVRRVRLFGHGFGKINALV